MRMLRCEFYKNVTVKYVLVIVILTIMVLLGYSMMFDTVPNSDWKENALKIKALQEEGIQALKETADGGDYDKAINYLEDIVLTINYCIENDIPYNPSNVYFYLVKIINLFPFVMVLVLIWSARAYSVENENCAWRNLIGSGNKRVTIIMSKIIFSIVCSACIYFVYTIIGIIVGLIRFGINGNNYIYVKLSGENFVKCSYIKDFGYYFIVSYFKSIFLIVIMFLLLCAFNNDKVALIITIFIYFFSGKMHMFVSKYEFSNFLPFKYIDMDIETIFYSGGVNNIFFGVLLVYILIAVSIILLIFNKREL